MSSHILQEIQATVDRIIIIDKGNIVADGTSEELISDSQGKTQLHLDVINAEENDIQDMKAVIPSVSVKTIKKLEESVNITLEYQNTSDPRKDIFNYAVEKGWILTEMTLTRKNLEDIFRNLTGQGTGGTDE